MYSKEKKLKTNLKKGSILITVLVVISMCTSLALYMHEKAINSYGSVADLQMDYQGAVYAMTAIQALRTVFYYDDANYDSTDDLWNNIPPIPVDKGFITVYIKPLNAKFPLNGLSLANEEARKRYEEGFNRLMVRKELSEITCEELKNWVGTGDMPSERYDENSTPYSTKGAAITTLAELAFIPAYEEKYKTISKYVSTGDSGYKININLASEDVIVSLIPELEPYATDIIDRRASEPYKNVSEIYELIGNQEKYNEILPFFDVKSSLFYVKIELDTGSDNYKYYHLLVRRTGRNAKAIKYIEGGNIDYF